MPGRYIHFGLTSSDVLDTALALQLVASVNILLERVEELSQAIRYQAQQHRNTVMVGRYARNSRRTHHLWL